MIIVINEILHGISGARGWGPVDVDGWHHIGEYRNTLT